MNWPVYRYSEVLLFLAEALMEQNKLSEAIPYLNQVRTRAGLGQYYGFFTDCFTFGYLSGA